jgi:hypothetical protein
VVSRIGVDLAPRPDEEWLRACIFTDQPERLARLDAALEIARDHPPPLVRGDALELLGELIAGRPAGGPGDRLPHRRRSLPRGRTTRAAARAQRGCHTM